MSLSFILFLLILAGLIVFLYIRAGKQRGKRANNTDGGDTAGGFNFDSGSHCGDSGSGGCGGDGGGGD
jgi:hypothetical protein